MPTNTSLLRRVILPALGPADLTAITPAVVRQWHGRLDHAKATGRAHAYGLLRTILNTAVADDLISANPCRIRGAGASKRKRKIKIATAQNVEDILARLPRRYHLFVLLHLWCSFRPGEITELRRGDVNLREGTISISRAVGKVPDPENPGRRMWVVGPPKSEAGIREIAVPEFLVPLLRARIEEFSQWGKDGLLFPAALTGGRMDHGMFYKSWDAARRAAGRPDLRLYDLRHTGATLAARNGATLKENMARLGQSTFVAAMQYQHAAEERDREVASKLNAMALAGAF